MKRVFFGVVSIVAAWTLSAAAIDSMVDPQRIQEAIAIGQSTFAADRTRFHALYRVIVAKSPVDYLEIVTPFRRVELAAETRASQGDRRFGQRQARETLAAAADELDVRVELTFHPLNTYVGVPDYVVTIIGAANESPIEALRSERFPRFGTRVEGPPALAPTPSAPVTKKGAQAQPVLGGLVVAHFDVRTLDASGSYDVVIAERGNRGVTEIARARVDLSRMR
jgi:hypothetical protein